MKSMLTSLLLSMALVVIGAIILLFYFLALRSPGGEMPRGTVEIKDKVFAVEIANTTSTRARGLSGRDGLPIDTGMLFTFGSPGKPIFWMKEMKFPIDIIWVQGERVAGFAENAAPEPGVALFNLKLYRPPMAVDKVLEVAAGTVAQYGLVPGDTVEVR